MKISKLLPLVLIVAVLAGLVVLKQKGNKQPSIISQVKLAALVPEGLKASKLEKLELYAGAKTDEKVVLKREGDEWLVSSHYNAPVKEDTIDEYLTDLLKVQGEFRASADSDSARDAYALKDDQAFHVLAYDSADGDADMHLLVGKAPDHRSVFLRKAGEDTVYVEAINLRQKAGIYGDDMAKAPTADHWLNKEILALNQEAVTKVALTYPDKALEFEKQEKPQPTPEPVLDEEGNPVPQPPTPKEYEWVLTKGGLSKNFKEAKLTSLLSKLAALSGSDVVDPDKLADWGLATPGFKCVVSREGEADITIEAGRPGLTEDGYLRLAGAEQALVYKLSSYDFEQLFPGGDDLFDLPQLALNEEETSRIVLEQPEGRVVVEKLDDNWRVTEPAVELDVQSTSLDTLAETLADWTATDYADGSVNTGPFDRKATIMAGGQSHTISVAGDARGFDGIYARLDGDNRLLGMSRNDVSKIFLTPRDVYQLDVLDMNESDVTAFKLSKGGVQGTASRLGDAWNVTMGSETFEKAGMACDDFIYELSEIQPNNFRVGSAVIDAPLATVTLTMKDGAETQIQIGAEEKGVHPMTLSGKSCTFEITKAAVDSVFAQWDKVLKKPEAPAPEVAEASAVASPTAPEASPMTISLPNAGSGTK